MVLLGLGLETSGLGLVFLALASFKAMAKVKVTDILPNTVYHGIITLTVGLHMVYQRHWYRHSAITINSTLALISGLGLGLGLKTSGLGLGLGLETPGLVNIPAFDTVDHELLLLRLERQFGLRGTALM